MIFFAGFIIGICFTICFNLWLPIFYYKYNKFYHGLVHLSFTHPQFVPNIFFRNYSRLGTTWGWILDDRIFMLTLDRLSYSCRQLLGFIDMFKNILKDVSRSARLSHYVSHNHTSISDHLEGRQTCRSRTVKITFSLN